MVKGEEWATDQLMTIFRDLIFKFIPLNCNFPNIYVFPMGPIVNPSHKTIFSEPKIPVSIKILNSEIKTNPVRAISVIIES